MGERGAGWNGDREEGSGEGRGGDWGRRGKRGEGRGKRVE